MTNTITPKDPLVASVVEEIDRRVKGLERGATRAPGESGFGRAIAELLVVRSLLTGAPNLTETVEFPAIQWLLQKTRDFGADLGVDQREDNPAGMRYHIVLREGQVISPYFDDISMLDRYIADHQQQYETYAQPPYGKPEFWLAEDKKEESAG